MNKLRHNKKGKEKFCAKKLGIGMGESKSRS
jgi:hypothetical protein